METCGNCGRTIGKLETPFLWRERVVCCECHKRLNSSGAADEQEQQEMLAAAVRKEAGATIPYATPVRPTTMPAGGVICPNPNCGYRGMPAVKSKSKVGISMTLIALWLVFGVLSASGGGRDPSMWVASLACFLGWLGYTIFSHGKTHSCPRCGITIR